jgi:predicted nucleotidyltransferase
MTTPRPEKNPHLIHSIGTRVVTRNPVFLDQGKIAQPAGAVGIVIHSPLDRRHHYRIRFLDGWETMLHHDQLTLLAEHQWGALNSNDHGLSGNGLFDRVIFRCVVGSRAFGLDLEDSDTDRRGIYLPTADQHWSLYGIPEQLENETTQEAYWELQKFLILALKANPNILECLYSPIVELATPLAEQLLEIKDIFLSKLVYQTYHGYVLSQFKKMQSNLRNQGRFKPKHLMHLIRLLLCGIQILREGYVPLNIEGERDRLLAIRRGEMPWTEVEAWRQRLHQQFNAAYATTRLPDRPDYARANQFLLDARRLALHSTLP